MAATTTSKRTRSTSRVKSKSKLQQLRDQPPVDIIDMATNLEENMERAAQDCRRVHETIKSVHVGRDNVDATIKLVRDLEGEVALWSRKFDNLCLAFHLYKNSIVTHIKDKARANPYGESQSQSLIPYELT